jgi:hemerythrin superfamily protein
MNPFKEFMNQVENKMLESRSDVISLIKADHRKVDQLFAEYVASDDNAEKEKIIMQVIDDLRVHAGAEEGKVYPVLDKQDHNGSNECLEEHHLIKILIEELSGMHQINDKVDAKMKVLSEVVKHHVNEEENKYLPELEKSGEDLDELGEEFMAEKERLQKEPVKANAAKQKAAAGKKRTVAKRKPAVKEATAKKTKKVASKTTVVKKAAKAKAAPKAKTAAPAKKATAARKAAPKKTAPKKTAPKKAAPAKKVSAIKKAAAKKATAVKKTAAAKKASSKKTASLTAHASKRRKAG